MVGLIMGASPLCVTIMSPIIGYFVSLLHQEYTLVHMYMYLHIDSLNNYCIFFECIILVVNISNFICYYYLSNFLFCYYYFSNFLFVITISLIFCICVHVRVLYYI